MTQTPDYLGNLGLTPDQATIYIALLTHGPQTASGLAKLTTVKRTYIYYLCQELAKENLIKLTQQGRTTTFTPMAPEALLAKAEEKRAQAHSTLISLEALLPELQSKYRAVTTRPSVSYFEGVDGLRKVYKDVINTKENICLFRSVDDESDPKAADILKNHVEERTKAGIHTRAITPMVEIAIENFLHNDQARLFERHLTKNKDFLLPSQIMVYGSKVAITSFKTSLSTIIDNKEISQTFKQLFELLWQYTEAEHNNLSINLKK